MDQKQGSTLARCSVVGGEKVAEAAGGREALCIEIEKALADAGRAESATVEVHVRKTHLIAMVRMSDGTMLPDIGLAVSDAPLSKAAIKKFAAQIAAAVRGSAA